MIDLSGRLGPLQEILAALAPVAPSAGEGGPSGREAERLQRLQAAARHCVTLPAARTAPSASDDALLRRAGALRRQTVETLRLLARHTEGELPAALQRALRRWDQAGDVCLLSPEGRRAALELQTSAQEALALILRARHRDPALLVLLASAAEAVLAVDSACALLRAVETRFVSLLRAQLQRSAATDAAAQREALLPGGVPFLGLAQALRAAAGEEEREEIDISAPISPTEEAAA